MLGLADLVKFDGPYKQIYYLETNRTILHKEDRISQKLHGMSM